MILVDTIANHKKFLLAGQLIGGPAGASRALALYVAAIGYAREGLTDGVIHDEFVEKFWLDSRPKSVAKALASKKVQLFHRIKGGYQIHDFHHHNGSADKLRHQRELARERKRKQRANEAVENLLKTEGVKKIALAVTRDTPRDSEKEKETERERETEDGRGTGASTVRSPSPPVGVPTVIQRPHGREFSPSLKKQRESRNDELSRSVAADDNFAVLVKLAHTVIDETHETNPTSPELIEAVKTAAASRHIRYPADTLNRALRSAAMQRLTGGAQPKASGPLAPLVNIVRTAIHAKTPEVFHAMAKGQRR